MSMVKRWMAEIADVRKDHPVLVVVRDNAGENTSKELNNYFRVTECGVKNHFSTPCEQWQNGMAQASVSSVTIHGKSVMAESGPGGPFWFCATTHGVKCRNATYKERLGTREDVRSEEECIQVQTCGVQGIYVYEQGAQRQGTLRAQGGGGC